MKKRIKLVLPVLLIGALLVLIFSVLECVHIKRASKIKAKVTVEK